MLHEVNHYMHNLSAYQHSNTGLTVHARHRNSRW